MDLLFPIAGVLLLVGVPVYLHAVVKLGGIVQAEHPEWLGRKGSLSFFYTGMPRVTDPNAGISVLGVAFGTRWRTLHAPAVPTYVSRIRLLLPLLMVVFVVVLVATAVLKP